VQWLFQRYANKGMYRPKTDQFGADDTITLAEVIKLVKDVAALKVSKDELTQCFKLVAHRLDTPSLTQPQFCQFVTQLALNLWKDGRPTLKGILCPPSEQSSQDVIEIQARVDKDS
jgi:hypothetical protein